MVSKQEENHMLEAEVETGLSKQVLSASFLTKITRDPQDNHLQGLSASDPRPLPNILSLPHSNVTIGTRTKKMLG